jgi:hypothetical protein
MPIIPYTQDTLSGNFNNIQPYITQYNVQNQVDEFIQSMIYELDMYNNDFDSKQAMMMTESLLNKYSTQMNQKQYKMLYDYYETRNTGIAMAIKNYMFL